MTPATTPTPPPARRASSASGWLLAFGFVVVAGALIAFSRPVPIPIAPPATVDRARLVPGPVRRAMADPPRVMVEGLQENCNACHQIFKSEHPAGASLSFHKDISLHHGLNDRCVNCHDPQDRERLVLRDGGTVPFSQAPQLCAQCHGTVFRDWQKGMHGKTLGSWVTGSEQQVRLNCNQCHDPHSPRYPPYTPLPGPNTLRMGDRDFHAGAHPSRSPLQRGMNRPAPLSNATAPGGTSHE